MTDDLTWEQIKARKKPVTTTVSVCLDPALAESLGTKRAEAKRLRTMAEMAPGMMPRLAEAQAAEDELRKLESAAAAEAAEFLFESVGRPAYNALIDEHPPTPKQKTDAKNRGEDVPMWNADTFPIALISASLVSPKMTVDQVDEMFNSPEWNQAECLQLYLAASSVNTQNRVYEAGNVSQRTTG